MVFMPPGSAKSTYGTVRGPAYYLGRKPENNVICGSYSGDLAESFGKKCRNLIDSSEHQILFPGCKLSDDTKSKGEWETRQGGGYKSCGVDGSITGRRADLGIIDDPVKGRKEADSDTVKETAWGWFKSDFLSRLKPGAAIIVIQTRWVEDDISGHILPDGWDGESGVFEGFDGEQWEVICLQAQAEAGKNDPLGRQPGEYLWTDWFTPEYWEETKAIQTSGDMRNWSALYQQTPSPEGGSYFKRKWFQYYTKLPDALNIYISHDDAVTDEAEGEDPDWTEIAVWGVDSMDNIYALAWYSEQVEMVADVDDDDPDAGWIGQLIDMIKQYAPFAVIGEAGVIRRASEPMIKKQMRKAHVYPLLQWLPHIGDKAAKSRNFQALAKLRNVYFPRTEWAEAVINQLVRFPGAAHDDKVDACGLIGRAIHQTWAAKVPKVKKEIPIEARKTIGELMNLEKTSKKVVNRRI